MATSTTEGRPELEPLEWPVSRDVLAKHVARFGTPAAEPDKVVTGVVSIDRAVTHAPQQSVVVMPGTVKHDRPGAREIRITDNVPARSEPATQTDSYRQGAHESSTVMSTRIRGRRLLGLQIGSLMVGIALIEGAYIANAIRQPPPTITVSADAPPPPARPIAEPAPIAAAGASAAADLAAARTGRLVVDSEPPGAQVLLDGRVVGIAPITLAEVQSGAHQLLVRHGGTELRQTLELEPGSTLSVLVPIPVRAPAASGYIALTTPIVLDVFESGAHLGTSRSPRIMLEAGMHTLLLTNDQLGFRRVQDVRVEPGRTTELAVAIPQGTIHINARPWAEVLIDGTPVGETPIGNLPITIGTHEIVFRHPQFGERKATTTVSVGTPARVAVDLTQPPSQER